MKKTLLIFAVFSAFLGCLPDPKLPKEAPKPMPQNLPFSLVCEPVGEDMETAPKTSVFLLFKDSKVKLGDISKCNVVTRESWPQLGIPDSAIVVTGGWWAGSGDYFFVVRQADMYKVFQVVVDEQMEGSPVPQEIYGLKIE